jgi:putative hydrolase of the HAD superfamily
MIRLDTLFFDVGGVGLTDGWDTDARLAAASHFVLNVEETEGRHQALADGFERGELSLDAYLDHVVFHCARALHAPDPGRLVEYLRDARIRTWRERRDRGLERS